MSKKKLEGNLYDRVFKENAEAIFMPLIQKELDLKIKEYKALPTKFSKTLEREMDFVFEILTESQEKEILHIEFQAINDKKMKFRIGEYHALLWSKYKMPIHHIVVYLGKSKTQMDNNLSDKEIYKGFTLINLNQLNSKEFLESQIPEVVILAILTHTEKGKLKAILRLIIQQLKILEFKYGVEFNKYLNQLTILSRMRKFEEETKEIIEDMIIQYDIEQDYFYKQGMEKGMEKGVFLNQLKVVEKSYENQIPVSLAANLSGLSIEKVKEIYDNLDAKNKK